MEISRYRLTIERHQADGIPFYLYAPLETPDAPLCVVLHGLNSSKERMLEFCLLLTEAGKRVCALDLRSQGERRNEDTPLLGLPWSDPQFTPAIARVITGSVSDVATAASYLNAERYTLLGRSLGGFIALLTALEDARAVAVCCMSGALNLSALPAAYQADSARYDPARRAAELARKPVLLLHGTEDQVVPLTGARRLWSALTASGVPLRHSDLREYPGVGHEFAPKIMRDAVAWVRELE